MRWFYTLVAVSVLVGCSGAPDDHREGTGQAQDAGSESSRPAESTDDPAVTLTQDIHEGPCGRAEVTHVKVDGGEFIFVIPLPCNPYYRDIGDPQPKN